MHFKITPRFYGALFDSIKLALLIFFSFFTNPAFTQQPLFTTQQHFGVEEGLPQSFISGIMQDEDGFIWLATSDGFCRYDGRGFKTIRYRPNDPAGLAANTIANIRPQANNYITVFYSPLLADDFNLRTFKVSRNTIRNVLSTIPNALWQTAPAVYNTNNCFFMMADNKGVGWLNSPSGKIYYANKTNGLLEQDTISAMVQSAGGKIYLVSENGVQVRDTTRQKFEWVPFATHVKKPPPGIVGDVYREYYSIVCLPHNRLAIADSGKITILDISKKTSRVFWYPVEQTNAMLTTSAYKTSPSGNQGVKESGTLQVDSKGQLYFSYYGRIFRIAENGELKLLWENTANPNLRITVFYIDRSDVLWVSVNAQGLEKIDLQALPFHSYLYKTNFMVDVLVQAGANRAIFSPEWNNRESPYYFRQAQDSKGNGYACFNWLNQNEIYQVNQQGIRLLQNKQSNASYSAMMTMPDGSIRVFDTEQSAWYNWKTQKAVPEKIQLDADSMKGVELADAKYAGGFTWLSTYSHGLLQYQDNKRINRFAGKLPNGIMPQMLTEICVDPVDKNKFWIGSRGGGLILWDAQRGLQKIYTIDEGLPNNTVYCILADKAGNIWCSTNKGIFRFNVTSKQITTFEKTDGLPGNEFNRAHKFIFPDGRLAFGGLDGYTIFNPAEFNVKNKTVGVMVLLTGLQINNQPQDISIAGSIVKEPLSTLKVIELPYNKNYLRFEFSAMQFNQPQKTRYRYRLQGVDKEWVENGTSNTAAYAALRRGNYIFTVTATDNNGLWSNTVKELRVIINPPFWATWWASLVYALIVVWLIQRYFVFRDKQLKAEQTMAFEKREALRLREVDELKDRFFSNITHEFRTPLTLIITPLEKLLQDTSLSSAAVSMVKTVQRNSGQLLRLINEFLDFSKLNNGQLKLKLSTGDPVLFTAECVNGFAAAAKDKNIQLSFKAKDVAGFYWFDEDKWEKIITNLLGNALKFTPQNGTVSVLLSPAENNNLQLQVIDNGPGIPHDQQQKIFIRFYQVDDSAIRTTGGTGIGLSLVKELTALMHGTVTLQSKQGGPTLFTVSVPMQKIGADENIAPVTENVEKQMVNNTETDAPLLLVVEDNDELRAFLMESMAKHYRVMGAGDGLKAWEIILEELPDIVISDVMMPGQDGFDLCRQCKSDNRTAHIGFILLTSKAAQEAKLKGLQNCADDYITKPFHLQELELRTASLVQLQKNVRAHLQAQLIATTPQQKLPGVTDPFLVQLYKEIDVKIDDAELGVDYLCKAMAMSRSTLNRKLKSLLGISTGELVRQYRLQKAGSLLSSGINIATAAYQLGFSSPSYFSQCFKEQYGITPSDYVLTQG